MGPVQLLLEPGAEDGKSRSPRMSFCNLLSCISYQTGVIESDLLPSGHQIWLLVSVLINKAVVETT